MDPAGHRRTRSGAESGEAAMQAMSSGRAGRAANGDDAGCSQAPAGAGKRAVGQAAMDGTGRQGYRRPRRRDDVLARRTRGEKTRREGGARAHKGPDE